MRNEFLKIEFLDEVDADFSPNTYYQIEFQNDCNTLPFKQQILLMPVN